jgi:Na+-transporting methylmalonyl-CoA/oxaloacetate decarboxylase gamma subunit
MSICITAFAAVFLLLAFLAAAMRGITEVFPFKQGDKPMKITKPAVAVGRIDTTLVAAITRAVNVTYPGTKILHIEEEK